MIAPKCLFVNLRPHRSILIKICGNAEHKLQTRRDVRFPGGSCKCHTPGHKWNTQTWHRNEANRWTRKVQPNKRKHKFTKHMWQWTNAEKASINNWGLVARIHPHWFPAGLSSTKRPAANVMQRKEEGSRSEHKAQTKTCAVHTKRRKSLAKNSEHICLIGIYGLRTSFRNFACSWHHCSCKTIEDRTGAPNPSCPARQRTRIYFQLKFRKTHFWIGIYGLRTSFWIFSMFSTYLWLLKT